jgi:hypothetical protein
MQIQDSNGDDLLSVSSANLTITISGTSTNFGSLDLLNEHFESTQTTTPTIPTAPTSASCGSGATATPTTGSTDAAGSFTVTTGSSGVGTGTCDTTIKFNQAYSTPPKSIIITPTTAISGTTNEEDAYVSAVSATSFTITVNTRNHTPANGETFSFNYWIIE